MRPSALPGSQVVLVEVQGGRNKFQNLDQYYLQLAELLKAQGANQVGLCAATNTSHHSTWAMQANGRYDSRWFQGSGQMNTIRGVFTNPEKPAYLHPVSVPTVGVSHTGLVSMSQLVPTGFDPLERTDQFLKAQDNNMLIMQVEDLKNPGASYMAARGIALNSAAQRARAQGIHPQQAIQEELNQPYVAKARTAINEIAVNAAHYTINTAYPPGDRRAITLKKAAH